MKVSFSQLQFSKIGVILTSLTILDMLNLLSIHENWSSKMVNGTHDKIVHALFKLALKKPNQSHFTLSEIATEAKISR